MKVIKILSILVVIVSADDAVKECEGGLLENLDDGCVVIKNQPLVIEGLEDVNQYENKLKTIKTIHSGLEINHNTFTTLPIFPALETIENLSGGYAIKFVQNTNLIVINFKPAILKTLRGKVYFYDDNFIKHAYSDVTVMNELLVLEAAARDDDSKCQTGFLEVELAKIPAEVDYIWWILLVICLIIFIVDIFLILRIILQLRNFDSQKDQQRPLNPDMA